MTYIVMDLEWNQPVSKNSYPYLKIGDKMSNEIIQIGAYKVSEELEIIDSFCTYIKPRYYKKLNSFVKRVTQINKDIINSADGFDVAIERFKNWCGDDFSIFTWGNDDVYVMKQNLDFYGMDKSFITKWYDMQMIFSSSHMHDSSQRSLRFAMEYFGIEEDNERRLHDALDDAYYTAKVFTLHDIKDCLCSYELTSDFDTMCMELDDTRFGSFYSKNKALHDARVAHVFCPECGESAKEHSAWISLGGKYVCIASCEKHGEFVSRVKINKHLDGKFYVNKITQKASTKMREDIKEKYRLKKEKSKSDKKKEISAIK